MSEARSTEQVDGEGSSSGRTAAFDAANAGSSPAPSATSWFIILYEWQACLRMSTDSMWYPAAYIFANEQGARSSLEALRKHQEPAPGYATNRNIRGPFAWSEPAP